MNRRDYLDELNEAIKQDRIQYKSREELEQYAIAVCLSRAHGMFGERWQQIAETVRLLLMVKLSEQFHAQSLAATRIGTRVAIAALIAVVAQTVLVLYTVLPK